MAEELGPIHGGGKIVVLNPSDHGQVRQVTGGGSPQWVSMESATFSQCAITLAQLGSTAKYYADLPVGLDDENAYELLLFGAAATAFSDFAELMEYTTDVAQIKAKTNNLSFSGTRVEAIVDAVSVAGGAAVWSYATRTLTGPVRIVETLQHGEWAITRGDSRLNADGTAQTFTKETGSITWPSTLVSGSFSVKLEIKPSVELLAETPAAADLQVTGTVVDATNVRFDITSAQSATLSAGVYLYNVVAFKSGVQYTLESGPLVVEDNVDA